MTELFIVMVLRTQRPFGWSKPGRALFVSTLLVAGISMVVPYTPLAPLFGLVPLPTVFLVTLSGITVLYLLASELAKQVLFSRLNPTTAATST
jgi:Mg2+-importing ATPase